MSSRSSIVASPIGARQAQDHSGRQERRAAAEPFIGHTKAEHRTGSNYLKGRDGGGRINVVLAVVLPRRLGRVVMSFFGLVELSERRP
jgi:hypothetical protein